MKKSLVLLTLGFSFTVAAFAQQAAKNDFDGKTWWDYVKVLADDNMEGRETGSAGLEARRSLRRRAAQSGWRRARRQRRLLPAREIRACAKLSRRIPASRSFATEKAEPLALGEDAFFNTRVNLAPEIEAPLVFVGYGLTIPEKTTTISPVST